MSRLCAAVALALLSAVLLGWGFCCGEWSHVEPGDMALEAAKLGLGYGSIPIHSIFRGMNIHLPAILMFTRGIGF